MKPSDETRTPRLALALRALVHGVGAWVFAWPLTRTPGVAAAVLGATIGALLGPRLARSRLRSPVLALAIAGVGGLTAWLARWVIVDNAAAAASLGPASALRMGDALFFFFAMATVSMTLRAMTARRQALAALEVVAVGLAFAQLVVAHRHGAINRPFELADPILAIGGDPTQVIMLVGAVAMAVVVVLLMSERRVWRTLFHLASVAVLLVLFLGATDVMRVPEPPPPANGLGLRPQDGEPEDGDDGQGGGDRQDQDELEFRDHQDSSNNRVPVAVVLFHDDYSPPRGVYYFRQGAFSQYNGRRLVSAVASGVDADIGRDFPTVPYDIGAAPPVNVNRTTIDTTVALLADHTRPFGLEAPIRFEPAPNPDPDRFRRTYRVTSAVLTATFASMLGASPGSAEWDSEQWTHYTTAPSDPRFAELTERVLHERLDGTGLYDDPAARVGVITNWLGEVGIYSLRNRHSDADDPTADFLFGNRTGYCVHFAHAATYMLRAAGVPARVATGYAIEEAARQGGSALLLSGEASHAWPEVYFQGFGWVVADVTPQTVISPPPSPPDPDLQRLLGELARGLEPVPPDPSSPLPQALSSLREIGVGVALTLLGGLALFMLFLVIAKVWRGVAPRFVSTRAQPRVAYRAALDRLSELQLTRARGESREAFAERIRDVAPSFVGLTATHVGAAFGSRFALQRAEVLPRTLRVLTKELGAATPLWRRVLGRISPWTWLTSR